MRSLTFAAVAVIGCVALGAPPERHAEPPAASEKLPALGRELLKKRMSHHAIDMQQLLFAVLMLQRDDAKTLALRIAAEPQLVRPFPGDRDTLNQMLPEKFFVLQAELKGRAQRVAEAAGSKNDQALAESFGALNQTCVSCHSAFLEPKISSPKVAP